MRSSAGGDGDRDGGDNDAADDQPVLPWQRVLDRAANLTGVRRAEDDQQRRRNRKEQTPHLMRAWRRPEAPIP